MNERSGRLKQQHGFNAGGCVVGVRHLLLNIEVGSGAGALHNHAGVQCVAGHFNGEAFICSSTHTWRCPGERC